MDDEVIAAASRSISQTAQATMIGAQTVAARATARTQASTELAWQDHYSQLRKAEVTNRTIAGQADLVQPLLHAVNQEEFWQWADPETISRAYALAQEYKDKLPIADQTIQTIEQHLAAQSQVMQNQALTAETTEQIERAQSSEAQVQAEITEDDPYTLVDEHAQAQTRADLENGDVPAAAQYTAKMRAAHADLETKVSAEALLGRKTADASWMQPAATQPAGATPTRAPVTTHSRSSVRQPQL